MEENKNNAVEKVENIINGTPFEPTAKEIEKARAQESERLEYARHKLREKARKEQEKKLKKQLREEKRIAEEQRKKMLEEKTAQERQRLKSLERQARLEKKQAQRSEKARLKHQRFLKKADLKKQKQDHSHERKKDNRGYGGWLAAVIALGVSTIALASALTLTYLMPQEADLAMEAVYSKSFYDTVEQVDNIDLNLSKVLATKDQGAIQTYLVDLAINSELAENDLQQLPLQDESKYYTTKLVNQIGDYAKYLNKKLINGESLSLEDRNTLQRLYQANLTFKESLQATMQGMSVDYSFSSMVDGGDGNIVIQNFNELQNLSVQYPELIYDGPFSDGLDRKQIKGLTDQEITSGQAQDVFKATFFYFDLQDVKQVGESDAGIQTYNFESTVDGENLYAQISKKGGKLVMFAYAGSCEEVNYQDDQATVVAQEFLTSLGIKNMKPVWINLSNNVYTINFAYETEGVIVYSDLIKVRVCAQTNKVIGFESSAYWANHVERAIATPKISKANAKSKVWDEIEISTCRLAVVPIGQSTEKLCYEFSGEYNGSTYYVYIDAVNGKQVEMFKVIESTEGKLLM